MVAIRHIALAPAANTHVALRPTDEYDKIEYAALPVESRITLYPNAFHHFFYPVFEPLAVGQHGRFHRFTVDIDAVEAAHVDDQELAVYPSKFGVLTADGDVIE